MFNCLEHKPYRTINVISLVNIHIGKPVIITKTKVFWTRIEQEQVAQAAFRAVNEMGMKTLEAVRHGQNTLPASRRRPVTALNTVGNCADVIKRIEELRHADLVQRVVGMRLSEQAKVDDSHPYKIFMSAVNTFAISLLDQLDLRIRESEKRILAGLGTRSNFIAEELEQPQAEPQIRCSDKPKFIIVGLRGVQTTRVQQTLKAHVRLKFIDSTEPIHVLKSNAKEADNVFLMRKFISHAHQDAIEDKSKCVLVPGGLSNLQKILTEHFQTLIAKKKTARG